MKTNRLRFLLLANLIGLRLEASAFNTFECVRDLLPVTDRASFQSKRQGVEEPFLLNDKYLVFPEVSNGTVSGFYFYGPKIAVFYDAIEIKGTRSVTRYIGDLKFRPSEGIYEMVAQPTGLETVTVSYLPGYQMASSGRGGPVMLGSSVLPVIGAFVSRPAMHKAAYSNPSFANESDVKRWVAARSPNPGGRQPAAADKTEVVKTIVRLKTLHPKQEDELWRPLKQELKFRQDWIKTRNLDEKSFKQLTLIMEGSCKE